MREPLPHAPSSSRDEVDEDVFAEMLGRRVERATTVHPGDEGDEFGDAPLFPAQMAGKILVAAAAPFPAAVPGSNGPYDYSAGTINSSSEVWIGQANNNPGLGTGTYNVSGTAVLNVTNWLAVGRESVPER